MRERRRMERLVVRARRRPWLAYMREVGALIERRGDSPDPDVVRARAVATEVVQNHHGLLLGLPGRYPDLTRRSKMSDRHRQPDHRDRRQAAT